MNETKLDCMGLPCPQPVLKCKEILDGSAPKHVVIEVDNAAAAENVQRYIGSRGYESTTETIDGGFRISGTATGASCEACEVMTDAEITQETAGSTAKSGTVVFITGATLGSGDDELGAKLMKNFLLTLPEMGSLWRIILVNSAVQCSAEGHDSLETLIKLHESGVSILVCGTCLEHFGLMEKKKVGDTTNMLDVVTSLEHASKVIKV